MRKEIVIHPGDTAPFRNLTDYCVGTGRLDLALHREYQEQLSAVQKECHFRHVRGHGLFSDQLGIYQGPALCRKGAGLLLHLSGPGRGRLAGKRAGALPGAGIHAGEAFLRSPDAVLLESAYRPAEGSGGMVPSGA